MASYPILLSLEEGRERILQRTAPLGRESVSLEEADGRVLAEDVAPRKTFRPFPARPTMVMLCVRRIHGKPLRSRG